MAKAQKEEGRPVRCKNCDTFLCVEMTDGPYPEWEWSRSHGRNNRYRVRLSVGSINCHRCGSEQPIPPIEAMQPKKNGGKNA